MTRAHLLLFGIALAATSPALTTTRVSVASSGVEGNANSFGLSISADGRYVAFQSTASNLVAGDTNGVSDVFVHDRRTGATARVSVSSSGVQGNDVSYRASISADGRYVGFLSSASNLVSGDANGFRDVFVHDRQTGATTRVSVSSSGAEGNENCWDLSMSADGRHVAFLSSASNLVQGDTNNVADLFVRDRQTGATTRESVSSAGTQGNGSSNGVSISADGRFVAFDSFASNLVSGDTNGFRDVFVRDRQTGTTTRVSVSSSGGQGNEDSFMPAISADGRSVAFQSAASNLVQGDMNGTYDVFVHDRQTGTTTRVSVSSSGNEANEVSQLPSISADGRQVAFMSYASNLVSGDGNATEDVFVHDRQAGTTVRVSVSSTGGEGNGRSGSPSISADGRHVVFSSLASNLVQGDTNGVWDVFVASASGIGRWPATGNPTAGRAVP